MIEKTAFYINLIGQTMSDIQSFIILLLASFLLFGMPMMMLNFFSTPDQRLFSNNTENLFTNMIVNQYLMSLGDFHTSNYIDHEFMPLVWILFVMATFFTQITMLNMLIAIMGDTFDKVSENKKTFTTRTKLLILGDYTGNFLKQEKKNMFLFTINID